MPKAERERITDEMFASAPHAFVMLAELCLRNPQRVISRTQVHGQDIIDALQAEGRNIIFMVPHGWAIDLPAMLFAAQGNKVAGMFHHQKTWWRITCGIKPGSLRWPPAFPRGRYQTVYRQCA